MQADFILIAEDDPSQRYTLAKIIEKKFGIPVKEAANGNQALEILASPQAEQARLVLLDLNMPVMGGKEALKKIHSLFPSLPVVVITASGEVSDAIDCIRLGASDFITKPLEPERLEVSIRNSLKINDLSHEISRLRREKDGESGFSGLVGAEGGLAEAVRLGRKASESEVPALITGESGVGKELFARAIHGESARYPKPFVAINCGAIPDNLVESTLFGHERGAFTGAVAKALGKFREAEGGTLFLDEIGELKFDMQVKLLRALQQKEVEPVGLGRSVAVDVRIISATNRNLAAMVKEGKFRKDLFYRLNIFPLEIPPLRERKGDMEALAGHFLEKFSAAENRKIPILGADALSFLKSHSWPGNVRELENAISRAVIMCEGGKIREGDLKRIINAEEVEIEPVARISASIPGELAVALRDQRGNFKKLQELELEIIRLLTGPCGMNVAQAAKALGMGVSTVYKKLS